MKHTHTNMSRSISAINRLEWLLNGILFMSGGDVVSSSSGGSEKLVLRLFIQPDSVRFVHAGNWSCRANFTNGSVSEPISGGTLHVFGEYHTLYMFV